MKLIMKWLRHWTYRDRHGYQARSQYDVRLMDRYFRGGTRSD